MPLPYEEPFRSEARAKLSAASKKWWGSLTIEERAAIALKKSEAWKRLTPEQQEARIAKLRKPRPPRTEEHRRNMSEAHKKLWEEGGPKFKERTCHTCAQAFIPNSGHQRFCTRECKTRMRKFEAHGITAEDFWEMYEAQDGTCALCNKARFGWSGETANLVIDHCHDTGRVRGLLCGDCNTALGRFGDDPEKLRRAAEYLESH